MLIGEKLKNLRLRMELTQEELGDRCDLSKGFISQVERDLTSPSIATLMDILEALGSTPEQFFVDRGNEKIVFSSKDVFTSVDDAYKNSITWLVSNAQKNDMEPILATVEPEGILFDEESHIGEEFGYVLAGALELILDGKKHKVSRGESFYYQSNHSHKIHNPYGKPAKVLMVSSPPSF